LGNEKWVLHKGTTMKPDQMLSLLEWLWNSYLAINFTSYGPNGHEL